MLNLRHFTRATRIAGLSALGLSLGLALSACNPSTSSGAGAASSAAASAAATPSASTPVATATSPVAASVPAVTTTPTTAVPTAAPSATLVPMQSAAGGEFLSPSGNISCEVDYHRAGLTQVYCQTVTPPLSVTMGVTGKYTTCTGQQCLGNPGTGTPTLAYGTATGAGPFRCESASTGVTCIADGKGFRISASGSTAVSG
jgi:hypothetical protein